MYFLRQLLWYYKKRKCKTLTGVSHLRLFFYNRGVIGLAWLFLERSLRHKKLPAIPYCKHSIKQVETQMGFRVTNQTESQ